MNENCQSSHIFVWIVYNSYSVDLRAEDRGFEPSTQVPYWPAGETDVRIYSESSAFSVEGESGGSPS